MSLISPEAIAVGPDGSIYVSDYLGDRVFRLEADGTLVTIAGGGVGGDGPATRAHMFHPARLAVDSVGRVYVAAELGGSLRRIDGQGNITTLLSMTAPLGLIFDRGGGLYIASAYGELRRLDIHGAATDIDLSSVPPPVPSLGYMAIDVAGNLYLADRAPSNSDLYPNPNGGCRILRLTPDQKISAVAGTGVCGFSGDGGPASAAQLNDPNGMVFDSAGNLYVADSINHRIRRIDKSGIITTWAGTGVSGHLGDGGQASQALLAYPFGMALVAGHLMYVSDAGCSCDDPAIIGRVRVIDLSTGLITIVASGASRVVTP